MGFAIVAGPAVGTFLLLIAGPMVAIAIDGATFAIALLLIASLRVTSNGDVSNYKMRERRSAWNIIMSNRSLLTLCVGLTGCYATVTALQAGLAVAAAHRLGSAGAVGIFYSAVGVGSVGGAVLARRVPRLAARLGIGFGVDALAVVGFALISVAPAVALLSMSAAAGSLAQVGGAARIIELVGAEDVPRVNALIFSFGYTGMVLGAVGGLIGSATFWELPVVVIGCIASAGILAASRASIRQDITQPRARGVALEAQSSV
jgi:hypothetical protein